MKIKVISPSSPCSKRKIEKSRHFMENLGFVVEYSKNLFKKKGYLAGGDDERFEDLFEALNDDSEIIWASRGGYGSIRLLERLEPLSFKKGKTIIGYSDITALFCLFKKFGDLKMIYGPSFSELFNMDNYSFKHLMCSIFRKRFELKVEGKDCKEKEFKIFGGCLSILCSLLGTRFFPDLKGRYLFLEDVNEPLYRIERMLCQLKLSKILEKSEGIIIGHFGNVEKRKILKIVKEIFGEYRVLYGIRCGHVKKKVSLPFEEKVCFKNGKIVFFES